MLFWLAMQGLRETNRQLEEMSQVRLMSGVIEVSVPRASSN